MTTRDCTSLGHVIVEDEPACYECDKTLEQGDRIGVRVSAHRRHLGELTDPADVASVGEWDHAGLDGAA